MDTKGGRGGERIGRRAEPVERAALRGRTPEPAWRSAVSGAIQPKRKATFDFEVFPSASTGS